MQGKRLRRITSATKPIWFNRIVLDMTADNFRVYPDIGKRESIRGYLTPKHIHYSTELQRANTVFIGMRLNFEQRKAALMEEYITKTITSR